MKVTNTAIRTDAPVRALLGPTNTGKTYRAIERMMHYNSGIAGFPLRLLARENYDRVCAVKGKNRVALVTGEEKIIPRGAKYFCCTVEAMPIEQSFECLIVDEVQLAEDPERGHIFTDRILRARGTQETMFLGSDTMRVVLSTLVPGIEFEECIRFSQLSYTGYKKLSRLPKRSAVVSFSIDDVYATAEMIKRQRGGTAVVLGALSPRTRNKQVEMYQSGEVDFLVATDAIGMGLNMDIRHVALASTRKYDGVRARYLRASEMAQIAGRAGRYKRDGTFGITGRVQELDADVIEAIESHTFPSIREVCWRNAALNFDSPDMLLHSLEVGSGEKMLGRGRPSDDVRTLKALIQNNEEVMARANNPEMVRLLWEVCQIPDFRQTLSDAHQDLIAQIFGRVSYGKLDEDWVNAHIMRLSDTRGDVDALMSRISHIRTWTYISFKSQWLNRAEYWQEKAREIEDNLSDALHEALMKRFVDRRASVINQALEEGRALLVGIRANGEVILESHLIGHLQAFRFIPLDTVDQGNQKAIMAVARDALRKEIKRRVSMITNAKPEQFQLTETGAILWQEKHGSPLPGTEIAHIEKGTSILKPAVVLTASDLLEGKDRDDVQLFLQNWVNAHIAKVLEPLVKIEHDETLSGTVRGICYQVHENLGIVPRENLEDLIAQLTQEDRAAIRARRIKMGPILVFLWELTKPAAVRLRGLLWGLWNERSLPMPVPNDGVVSVAIDPKTADRAFQQAIGYPVYGNRAIRIDMLDRVISAVYDRAEQGKFQAGHDMCEWLGCSIEDLYGVLSAMGHKKVYDPAEKKDETPEDEAQAILKDAEVKAEAEAQAAPEAPTVAAEESKAEAETAAPVADASVPAEEAAKPAEQVKPELATFRLKKGKAFEKNREQKKPFNKNKPKGDHKGGKKKPRGNPKGKDYKQSKMSANAKKVEDSPFAILQQLKDKSG